MVFKAGAETKLQADVKLSYRQMSLSLNNFDYVQAWINSALSHELFKLHVWMFVFKAAQSKLWNPVSNKGFVYYLKLFW